MPLKSAWNSVMFSCANLAADPPSTYPIGIHYIVLEPPKKDLSIGANTPRVTNGDLVGPANQIPPRGFFLLLHPDCGIAHQTHGRGTEIFLVSLTTRQFYHKCKWTRARIDIIFVIKPGGRYYFRQ
jgi:hypothetical protein